jgi:septal ring factor EnvC (AmiA/AmiB activator)
VVQNALPLNIFKMYLNSLKTPNKIAVTKGNTASLSLLAKEFFFPELASECAACSVPVDPISTLSNRVRKLERRLSSFSNRRRKVEETIEAPEAGLETLRFEVENQRAAIDRKVTVAGSRVDELETEFEEPKGEIGILKTEAAKLGKSVPGMETLRPEFEAMKNDIF